VRRGTAIALVVGLAAVVVALVHTGAGAVEQALERLRLSGLLVLVILHLPIVACMGLAWWLASGDDPPASSRRFMWARFVRDAAGEALPFLQLGGVVFGLRALGRGWMTTVGAVSAAVDGVIELSAKLPYVLAALLVLLAWAAQPRVTGLLLLGLAATGILVAILLFTRRSLSARLEALARTLSDRWPAMRSRDGDLVAPNVRACFDRILAQRGRLWSGFALHLGCWCLGAGEAWITFHLLGVDLTLLQALALDGAVAGLRTFGFLVPAAAGVQEASFMLAGAVFGIPPAQALAASFTRRARDLTLAVATLAIAAVCDANFAVRTAARRSV
jgi:putative membrane protein